MKLYLAKLPRLDVIDARIVLRDLYEATYGIYRPVSKAIKRPLSSVAFHDAEMVNVDSLLEDSIRTYASRNVKDHFGLSLVEFMELPRDIAQMLLRIGDEINSKKSSVVSDIEKQLGTS